MEFSRLPPARGLAFSVWRGWAARERFRRRADETRPDDLRRAGDRGFEPDPDTAASEAGGKGDRGQTRQRGLIKRASQLAAEEILAMAEKDNAYERTLIEITVARTLRSIMEGCGPV